MMKIELENGSVIEVPENVGATSVRGRRWLVIEDLEDNQESDDIE